MQEFEAPCDPLPGRESEFEAVVSFVAGRLRLEHSQALFVYGACGCGKTSSVLRALRQCSDRPLPSDRQAAVSPSAALTNGGAKRAAASRSVTVNGGPRNKRARVETDGGGGRMTLSPSAADAQCGGAEDDTSSTRTSGALTEGATGSRGSTGSGSIRPSVFEDETDKSPFTLSATDVPFDDWKQRYPQLFATPGRRRIQAQYINCADLSPDGLAEALCIGLKRSFPRPDVATRELLRAITELPQQCIDKQRAVRGRRSVSRARSCLERDSIVSQSVSPSTLEWSTAAKSGHVADKQKTKTPLHVVALDEVEYVRPAARALLSELALLSFNRPSQLALVFISNHRDLVHVPPTLLQELPFQPYTVDRLRRIGMALVAEAVQQHEREPMTVPAMRNPERTARTPPSRTFTVSPTFYDFIARKALTDYAGDVRQVAVMCRRAVFTALEGLAKAQEGAPSSAVPLPESTISPRGSSGGGAGRRRKTASKHTPQTTPLTDVSTAMMTAVTTYSPSTTDVDIDGRVSGSSTASAAPPSPAGATSAAATTCTVTLANSKRVVQPMSMDEHLNSHVAQMPLHLLYVLSSLIALSLKRRNDQRCAAVAMGPSYALTTSRHATIRHEGRSYASSAMTIRDARTLYTALLTKWNFPKMELVAFRQAIDTLADVCIVTRPQRRGIDEVFSFTDTWPLEAMEAAIVDRGEANMREMEESGLVVSENQLAAMMSDLKGFAFGKA